VRINLHPLRLECLEQSVEIEALYVFNPLLRVIGKPALHVPLTLSFTAVLLALLDRREKVGDHPRLLYCC
jgi:hypothetical protein